MSIITLFTSPNNNQLSIIKLAIWKTPTTSSVINISPIKPGLRISLMVFTTWVI